VVAAPILATCTALLAGAAPAGAATADHTETFAFDSTTGRSVSCEITGTLRSVSRTDGRWDLSADVRITSASSNECFDGIAHMTSEQSDGTTAQYSGGGSFVQISAITPNEVTRLSYEIYFNGCGCYSPTYRAPK
jgi:hypothetical protein